jgi:hypothetical protein
MSRFTELEQELIEEDDPEKRRDLVRQIALQYRR